MKIYFSVFIVFLLGPSVAFADTFSSPNIIETSHEIRSKMKRATLHLRVTRVFKNIGTETDSLRLSVVLPPNSFITGLEYTFDGTWQKTKFMERNQAEALYFGKKAPRKKIKTLKKVGGQALLEKDASGYSLHVYPLSASGTVKIRYTLETLPKYEGRKFSIIYPQALDRKKFVEPMLFHSGKLWVEGKQIESKAGVNLGYGTDSRCEELKLPKTCHVIEVHVDETETPGVSYFSTKLSIANNGDYYHSQLLRTPQLVLDPNGKVVPFQNCTTTKESVSCRTPVKMQKGIWNFVISSRPSKSVFKQEAIFRNDVIRRRVNRVFSAGYIKLEFGAKTGPNEILQGSSRRKGNYLEARIRKPFSKLPKRARMIFLLDTSWSANEKGIARQIKLLESIVKHTNDETIEVLAYNRFVSYFTINPNDVDKSLRENAEALRPKNGSNLAAALDKAQALTRKGKRPTRIFVMSDLKIFEAKALENEYVLDLPKNVFLHFIAIDGGRKEALQRDDSFSFSRFARENRGIAVRVNSALEERFDEESLHLIRPARVDYVHDGPEKLPNILEGETYFYKRRAAKESYTLEGKLWQQDYVLKIARTKKGDTRMLRREIMKGEALTKDTIAYGKKHKVVTNFQSLIGMKNKNADGRPPRYQLMGYGYGASSYYRSRGRFHPPKIRRTDVLNGVFENVTKSCRRFKKGTETYTAQFSTTDFEIVSLRRSKGEKETDWSRCIHEGIWDSKLPNAVKTGSFPIHI